jgi:hypothetical protein
MESTYYVVTAVLDFDNVYAAPAEVVQVLLHWHWHWIWNVTEHDGNVHLANEDPKYPQAFAFKKQFDIEVEQAFRNFWKTNAALCKLLHFII